MWNFLVHGLSVGCTLVLYDGSPLRDPAYLWNLVDELGITIFGTSAKYIDQLSVSVRVRGGASFLLPPASRSFYLSAVLLFWYLHTLHTVPRSPFPSPRSSNAQTLSICFFPRVYACFWQVWHSIFVRICVRKLGLG